MFLFKYITFYKLAQLLEIYITVCFYLNEISAIEKVKDFYLHYSMFLFKQKHLNLGYLLNSYLHYSMFLFKLKKALVGRLIKANLHYSMFLFKLVFVLLSTKLL